MRAHRTDIECVDVFSTDLGWMAIVGCDGKLRQLVFGYDSPDAALAALGDERVAAAKVGRWDARLVKRLQAYARGTADDFRDVPLDLGPRTAFQRRVVDACRRIRCGATSTYATLASAAGCPGAARAVGNIMATNRVPLIVPCHRVLGASGRLGGYSNPRGLAMKSHLLAQEAASTKRRGPKRSPALA